MSIQIFIVAFVVSFLGSIPPGTINITSMQLSIQGQRRAAFFFALGASITELAYAGITVRFQIYLSEKSAFIAYFALISSLAMLVLGVINLLAKNHTQEIVSKSKDLKGRNGFKRGVVLGVLNPLTIPFWLTVTAYLQSAGWIILYPSTLYIYALGIALGTFALLTTVNKLGSRFEQIASNSFVVYKIPGITFLLLGSYGIIKWFF